jgi:hypothetical protein
MHEVPAAVHSSDVECLCFVNHYVLIDQTIGCTIGTY